ncbi:hypothetical protein CK203_105530 [Vitis vinifera]|uniref:Uncharacterized protein n=1 Tax=Vitis vinifera TaxID=29760 RepID=A0A438BQK0_VITVI|nr:hypothetical protein CK203_105530 [Vitis vinifera]
MASSSAMETLRERIAKMKEMLGDWPREDNTVASWVEHTMEEIQYRGVWCPAVYGEDIAVLKKAVLQECPSSPEAPPKVRVLELKGFNVIGTQRNWRISYGTWSSSLGLLMFLMTTKYPLPIERWAQMKLRRQGIHDLPAAMATVDCLVDYKMGWKKQNKEDAAKVKAMVDNGTTHNSWSLERQPSWTEIGRGYNRIKAINSKAQKIQVKVSPVCVALRAKNGGKGQPEMLSAI